MAMKNDRYRKVRGGYSRILQLACASCEQSLFKYQKDGPGILKRLYIDRILGTRPTSVKLTCSKCRNLLGTKIMYKKENRAAYRLFVGAITKKIIKN